MRLPVTITALAAPALVAVACHIADSDRCDSAMEYVAELNACVAIDTESDAPDGDAGADAGGPTGLMEPCGSQDDCAGYDASFCNLLMEPNVCLIPDCTPSPDDCPADYFCCDFMAAIEETAGLPDTLCIPTDSMSVVEAYCENL
jgi:hypothetical protein